jgi:hypothetical protein
VKTEIKHLWLSALRSGEYRKGTHELRRRDNYCCLGVLCDLWIQNQPPESRDQWRPDRMAPSSGRQEILGSTSALPDAVREWAGLEDNNPVLEHIDFGEWSCAELNDGEYDIVDSDEAMEDQLARPLSFEEIADLIEEQL